MITTIGADRNGEYLAHRNGTWIIDTAHAVQRMHQRGRSMKPFEVKDMFNRVLEYAERNEETFKSMPYNSEVFFYSQKHSRGAVMAHRKDTRGNLDGMHWVLLTIYPAGKSQPAHNETKRFMV